MLMTLDVHLIVIHLNSRFDEEQKWKACRVSHGIGVPDKVEQGELLFEALPSVLGLILKN